jgi:hypothetical protein
MRPNTGSARPPSARECGGHFAEKVILCNLVLFKSAAGEPNRSAVEQEERIECHIRLLP